MTIQQCRTAMDKLETSGEVTRYSTNKYQSVSLCKWEKLQKESNEVTSKLTDKQQTNNKQITTTKEYKNNKKLLDIDKFLSWFNNRKGHYTGKVGKFKTLSNTDKNNLKQLRDSYEGEDFERALRGLYASQWAKENKMHNPSHFLRVDNFNKYLDTEAEPIQEEDELTRIKRERGWIK